MKDVALILLVLRVHSSEVATRGRENVGDAVMKEARDIRNPRTFKGRELGIMGQTDRWEERCISIRKEKRHERKRKKGESERKRGREED